MASQNTEMVKQAYAAFGRRDIPALLQLLDEKIEWQAVIGTEGAVPTAGLRRGREGVGQFFKDLADSVEFEAFEPREFIAEGDQVAVVGRYKGKARPTGKMFDSEWVMLFSLRNGKIVRFREFTDSRKLVDAFA